MPVLLHQSSENIPWLRTIMVDSGSPAVVAIHCRLPIDQTLSNVTGEVIAAGCDGRMGQVLWQA